jgi:1-acyl-sn-glycerol-3-phosphate acyltransferase
MSLTAWGRVPRALGSRAPFDPYDLAQRDPAVVAAFLAVFERINRHYLRLRVEGVGHISARPALYVGNHNGGVMGPDLACTLATLWRALGPEYPLYAMAHDFAMRTLRPLGRAIQLVGAMRADPASAAAAFERGASVLAYPGGDLDAFRHFRDRNRVVFGERTGFIRVAQRAGVPIVPIVAHGAHRSAVIVNDGAFIAELFDLPRRLRLQRLPIAFGLPWGVGAGPLPYLPLPFAVKLRVLPAIEAPPEADPKALRDLVVTTMQRAMDEMAGARK